jgi:hypothetical protein
MQVTVKGRVWCLSNMWTYERQIWLTPSIQVDFSDGWVLDISFLIFKFYTYQDWEVNFYGEEDD